MKVNAISFSKRFKPTRTAESAVKNTQEQTDTSSIDSSLRAKKAAKTLAAMTAMACMMAPSVAVKNTSAVAETTETTPLEFYTSFRHWRIEQANKEINSDSSDAEYSDFDFMEGKDPENEEEYISQLEKLAQGEIEWHDADTDSQISLDALEYPMMEMLASSQIDNSRDTLIDLGILSQEQVIPMDRYNGNSDDVLTADELATYYRNIDAYQIDDEAVQKGKISYKAYEKYNSDILSKVENDYSDELKDDEDILSAFADYLIYS